MKCNNLIILIMLILSLLFYACSDTRKAENLSDEALKEYKNGNLDKAKELFEQALKADLKSAKALNGLGNISADQKRYKDAIDYYDQALKIDTTNPIYHINKATVLREENKYLSALNELEAAEKKVGNKKWIIEYERAVVFISWEKFHQAEKSLKDALKQESDIDQVRLGQIYSRLGLVYERKGDYVEARKNYQKAIDLIPGDTSIQIAYGIVLYRMGSYKEALDYLRKIEKKKPDNLVMKMYIGLSLAQTGNWDDALSYLETVKKADKNAAPETDFFLGRCYMEKKQYANAIEILKPLVNKYDNLRSLSSIIAHCSIFENNLKDAEQYAQNALKIDPKDLLAYQVLYEVSTRNKNKEKSEEYLAAMKKINPDANPIKYSVK
ncbi:MAG: tetratricopeptide repeat protein [Candidatus Coatesbacteria bacterium]|nr:tetratricopeptide repeat protein [Candidatus Coatesbacteria bacterium]